MGFCVSGRVLIHFSLPVFLSRAAKWLVLYLFLHPGEHCFALQFIRFHRWLGSVLLGNGSTEKPHWRKSLLPLCDLRELCEDQSLGPSPCSLRCLGEESQGCWEMDDSRGSANKCAKALNNTAQGKCALVVLLSVTFSEWACCSEELCQLHMMYSKNTCVCVCVGYFFVCYVCLGQGLERSVKDKKY